MIRKYSKIILILLFIGSSVFARNKMDAQDSSKVSAAPNIHFSWLWGVAQLIPSPQWILANDKNNFGMRWQITPILFSFGMNKKLSPWRYFITDPLARQSGSIEMFITPEYFSTENKFKDNWLFRSGFRVYIPIWQKGEYASLSFASSYYNFNGNNGISYEAGIYLFAGIVGFQTTYMPNFRNSEWIFTIRLRYF
ncbi:MAG: hypothetical protein KKF62_18830 [Bacteroidetes bacterium]|nr:hypothetical protein [Bacteroidota bacterium]MBU1116879.1 hypothetical protein [Bacteroidota bacterium]MBU1797443.1 hypothetical protein [Bacteroidota bacterium]